jgi:RNA polymerase sigma-70 factor (ECF subfamily)
MQTAFAIANAAHTRFAAAQATSDEMLIDSIADGEKSAMHILYARHHVRTYRFVLRIVRDANMAEDIVSQVFLDVWRTAGQFERRCQVSTWILSIARFKALSALRQRRFEDIEQDEVMQIADTRDDPEAAFNRARTGDVLRNCIKKLSAAHREVIELVYYHEMSVEEAGRVIGIPQATVKTRMFYARKALADMLRGEGIESLAA